MRVCRFVFPLTVVALLLIPNKRMQLQKEKKLRLHAISYHLHQIILGNDLHALLLRHLVLRPLRYFASIVHFKSRHQIVRFPAHRRSFNPTAHPLQSFAPSMIEDQIARFLGRETLVQSSDHEYLPGQTVWLSHGYFLRSMFRRIAISAQPGRFGFVNDSLPSVCRNGCYPSTAIMCVTPSLLGRVLLVQYLCLFRFGAMYYAPIHAVYASSTTMGRLRC